jgi:hypothetical protein
MTEILRAKQFKLVWGALSSQDRAPAFEVGFRRFESCRARHSFLLWKQISFLSQFFTPNLDKILQRPVIGFLCFRWEYTSWQLTIFPMILKAITAVPLSRTSRVCTTTSFFISFNITYSASHGQTHVLLRLKS